MSDDKPETLTGEPHSVLVGDRMKFTVEALRYIHGQENMSTVVCVVAEIKVEDDGSKTVIVTPL